MCENEFDVEIFAGDDTDSYGRHLIQVNQPIGLEPEDIAICVFQCGPITQVKKNPTFPYFIDFTASETKRLDKYNRGYLVCVDSEGKRTTLIGTVKIKVNKQVVADIEV